jgi:TonB family protein
MRLILITLMSLAAVGTICAQQLKPCERYSSKYRVLDTQALTKVAAHYPSEPGMRAAGRVTVLVSIDRRGRVVSARALCGHPLLVASSVAAARSWTFQPTRKHVTRVGTVSFDFAPTDALSRTGGA